MVDVLTARGHLDGGTVTESGHAVRRIYHPRGLLLAECLTRGLLSNLTVDEAVATIVVFRPSSSDPDAAIAPRGTVRERLLAAVELARQIDTALLGQGLEPIGRPELIEAVALRRWAGGAPLGEALAGTDWSAGQLVREARITAELADQLARCCRETRSVDDAEAFTTAASTLRRSVVMASAYDAPAPTKLTHPRAVP
jgi:ATP-dependent RNA helicase HelY